MHNIVIKIYVQRFLHLNEFITFSLSNNKKQLQCNSAAEVKYSGNCLQIATKNMEKHSVNNQTIYILLSN